MSEQIPKFFDMAEAGMDLITPAIKKNPASAIGGVNYEPRPEGYKRFQGYERFDGQGLPSKSLYSSLLFEAGTIAIVSGDVVTGLTSGATGKMLEDADLRSGTYGGGDAVGVLPLWDVAGTFVDGEDLQVSAVTRALADGTNITEGADNDTQDRAWRVLAVDARRALINTITGSGPILGIWTFAGNVYAFRDNVGGTACDMWKDDPSGAGWVQVDLQDTLFFDAGDDEFFAGDTINGQTSGATAFVERVVLLGGDYGTADAIGLVIVTAVTGTWQDNENLRVAASTKALVNGTVEAGALGAGGIFEFIRHNFSGGTDTTRMYGCNGTGKAFVFDGDFANITTGSAPDEPQHIGVKADTLFFAFSGGSLQFSGGGTPLVWDAVQGAGEIAMGDDITGICGEYSNGIAIMSRNKTSILYGTDFDVLGGGDAVLETINSDAGAIRRSVQLLVKPTFFDNTGIRDLTAVQAFGNFKFGDGDGLSGAIHPLITAKAKTGVTVTASVVIKDQLQYWLFFDDMSGIVLSMASGKPRLMPIALPIVVRCAYSTEDNNGDELVFIGSDDGFVYSFNTGNNFDGAEMDYFLRLASWNLGAPQLNKQFDKAIIELDPSSTGKTTLNINADFSYASPDLPAIIGQTLSISGGGGFWDFSNWDEFFWDASNEGVAQAHIDGYGLNISLGLGGSISDEEPHTITGNTYLYRPRRTHR